MHLNVLGASGRVVDDGGTYSEQGDCSKRNIRNTSWLAAATLIAGAIAGCADGNPVAGPRGADRASRDLVTATTDTVINLTAQDDKRSPWPVTGLLRDEPLAENVTVQKVIGPMGGSLSIGAAGFELDVPAGAVAVPTTFTVTALKGAAVAYVFGPEGSSFPIALRATQDLKGTNVKRLRKHAVISAGYFATEADYNAESGTATISQEIAVQVHPSGKSVSFAIPHFSGWLIHWRSEEPSDSTTQQ